MMTGSQNTEADGAARPRPDRITITEDEARQGDIVLRKRWQRGTFIGGIVAVAVVSLFLAWILA